MLPGGAEALTDYASRNDLLAVPCQTLFGGLYHRTGPFVVASAPSCSSLTKALAGTSSATFFSFSRGVLPIFNPSDSRNKGLGGYKPSPSRLRISQPRTTVHPGSSLQIPQSDAERLIICSNQAGVGLTGRSD